MIENLHRIWYRIAKALRAKSLTILGQPSFHRRGRDCKVFGWKNISTGMKVTIGDYCWIESVLKYGNQTFDPIIILGDNVSISDFTHISATKKIHIDDGCLLGSKIYIGDHSHGNAKDPRQLLLPPGQRPLSNIAEIYIGKNVWIGDGSIILAGTKLSQGCVVAANSVVKLIVDRPAIIAGNPATIIRFI